MFIFTCIYFHVYISTQNTNTNKILEKDQPIYKELVSLFIKIFYFCLLLNLYSKSFLCH